MMIGLQLFLALIMFSFYPPGLHAVEDGIMTDLDGKSYQSINHQKEFELLVFWATWCVECKAKMRTILPELDRHPLLKILAINTDAEIKRAQYFVQKEKPSVTILRDEGKKIIDFLHINSVPAWALYKRRPNAGGWTLLDHDTGFELDRIKKKITN